MSHSRSDRPGGAFAPHEPLAEALLPHATSSDDGSHDVAHLARVWSNAATILAEEGGAAEVVAAAALLHDCVTVEKNDPMRAQASRLAARKAETVLRDLGWDGERIAAVAHAIEAHSFSAAIPPETLEARILQDADRLDAIGMVGVARCFYIAGRMGSGLYDPADPEAAWRPLDDKRFAIDHFENKLFKLAAGFQTRTGARLAELRQARLRRFYDEFLDEI
ncbi:HD domain-containing protein [Kaistia nematophila]|uniref:HD domain-containing protein n=1 Tax=Kaistia nematophila TaxID=2994654 RepID=A0A9X3ILI0_9HYPH|nr:HD domain-containing protein [Kaistia nematophila]MCX5570543.1 HD domain-containing protein [Kaistia nematophila]